MAVAWEQAAWAAGAFCVLIGVLLIAGHLRAKESDPWKSPQILKLKEELKNHPRDEKIKQQIRELDLAFRGRYFTQLSRKQTGSWFLLGGAAVLILALTRRRPIVEGPYLPGTRPMAVPTQQNRGPARWAVAFSGVTVGAGLFALSLFITNAVPRSPADADKMFAAQAAKATVMDAATPQEMAANWPAFRGYQGAGFVANANPPVKFGPEEAIAWKVPAPLDGFNSPIVWSNRVFFSGGDAKKREVVCLDASSGKTLWRSELSGVPGSPTKPADIPDSTGYAAATMATDGRRVYVIFANGDLGGFSMDGRLLWSRGFGALENAYGHSTSLVTWQDRLLVQLDQGESESKKSRLYSIDGRTGRTVWEKTRDFGASWASPVAFEAGKPQLVALSLPFAVSYNIADGSELWRVDCLNGEVCPSPIFAGGMVYIASPSDKLIGVKPDGAGDVTKTHIAWSMEENVPDVTSPVSNGELVLTISTSGMLTCFDAKDGKKLWEKDYETDFHASPVIAGKHVYVFSQKGMGVVFEAAREYKELHRAELPDMFHATPAVANNSLFLRGMKQIWRIGTGTQAVASTQ